MKLPYNEQAERAIIGAVLNSDGESFRFANELEVEDFYFQQYQTIFSAMKNLHYSVKPIDLPTVTEELLNMNKLDSVGGVKTLQEIIDETVTSANISYYVNLVKDRSLLRQLVIRMNDLVNNWDNPDYTVSSYLSKVEDEILNITRNRRVEGFERSSKVLSLIKSQMLERLKSNELMTGIPTGIKELDRVTNGLQRGDFIIVAARPSMGKTALALHIMTESLKITNGTAAFFSLEMGSEQLMMRILASDSQVEHDKLKKLQLDQNDWIKIETSEGRLSKLNIYIDDTSGAKLSDIQTKAHKLKVERPDLNLILIDYIGLITTGRKGSQDNRQQEVSEISRGIKALARELRVPIICLSQLSRFVERRQSKVPILSDLRESGSIEQDADLVMLLYREDYYDSTKQREDGSSDIDVIIAKHRNGEVGKFTLQFQKKYGRFMEVGS
ncbi:TPA: replicative DNA helicase [bacterium]|jgi:replicative DNA helicase|nr:replicative DNA helicase [bacterium]